MRSSNTPKKNSTGRIIGSRNFKQFAISLKDKKRKKRWKNEISTIKQNIVSEQILHYQTSF